MISSETSRPCFMMSDVFSNVNHHVCWLCFKFLYKSLYKSIQNYHIFILWHRGFLNWGTPKESMFKFSNVHRTFHSKPSINWGYPPLDCVLFWLVSVTPWKSRFLPSKSWKVEKFASQEISARKVEKIEKFEKSKSRKVEKFEKFEKSKRNNQVNKIYRFKTNQYIETLHTVTRFDVGANTFHLRLRCYHQYLEGIQTNCPACCSWYLLIQVSSVR